MNRIIFIFAFLFTICFTSKAQDKKIFVWGGDIDLKFTKYIAELTGKENPRLCYLPTASGDHPDNIKFWSNICNTLKIDTLVLNVWVSSSPANKSFEDILLNSDAIVVGGGNTLNMIGIWKAQGIDKILKTALDKGIILSGGSAGASCCVANGISDSRPVDLSVVDGLGFLPYSNCPHYSQDKRRNMYDSLILSKKIKPGYACDEKAGILFVNGKASEFVSQNDKHNVYYICPNKKQIEIENLNARMLVDKDAIPEGKYKVIDVGKTISEIVPDGEATPLTAYVALMKEKYNGNKDALDFHVNRIFIFDDKIAGVVNDKYLDMMGVYGLWYLYNHNGTWESAGEDIGGDTVLESEITFREKAKVILSRKRMLSK